MADFFHFKGKQAIDHLKDARIKGAIAMGEIHGVELQGHKAAFCNSIKEMTVILSILTATSFTISIPLFFYIVIAFTFSLWKTATTAFLGYFRLYRLHRLIEEERWEIQHHREQEKQELTALYQAKGFSGKLLQDIVEVLMKDDNRLLQIMLEEELGLQLGQLQHPLKQSFGAFLGSTFSSSIIIATIAFFPTITALIASLAFLIFANIIFSLEEKSLQLKSTIWNLGIYLLIVTVAYFLAMTYQ